MRQDVFGAKGHFTTSPEITQIFGEVITISHNQNQSQSRLESQSESAPLLSLFQLLAVWLISEWQRVGCPKPFRIIELGPGRGTLASDMSRVVSQVSLTRHDTSLHLVEVSPYLTQVQKRTLSTQPSDKPFVVSRHGIPVSWYRDIDQVPNASSGFDAFVANEFFDALPVHKFQKNEKGTWNEIMIDSDSESKLRFIITPGETPASKVYVKVSSYLWWLPVRECQRFPCSQNPVFLLCSQNPVFLLCSQNLFLLTESCFSALFTESCFSALFTESFPVLFCSQNLSLFLFCLQNPVREWTFFPAHIILLPVMITCKRMPTFSLLTESFPVHRIFSYSVLFTESSCSVLFTESSCSVHRIL